MRYEFISKIQNQSSGELMKIQRQRCFLTPLVDSSQSHVERFWNHWHADNHLKSLTWQLFKITEKLTNAGVDQVEVKGKGLMEIHWLLSRGWDLFREIFADICNTPLWNAHCTCIASHTACISILHLLNLKSGHIECMTLSQHLAPGSSILSSWKQGSISENENRMQSDFQEITFFRTFSCLILTWEIG